MVKDAELTGVPQARPEAGELSLDSPELVEVRAAMLRRVRRVGPRWLVDQAEDVVQNALGRVLAHLQKRGGKTTVAASYLMKAAQNAAIDEIRARFRRPEIREGDLMLETRPAAVGAQDPARPIEALHIDRAIRECLGGLSAPRRRAVSLHLLGHTLAETGRALGWTPKKAEHLVYRGLADLRTCLEGKGVRP